MGRRSLTALLRSGQSLVAVNRKTGMLAAIAPKVEYEVPAPRPKPVDTSILGTSLNDSIIRIENAIATGAMELNEETRRQVRRIQKMAELQDEKLLEQEMGLL